VSANRPLIPETIKRSVRARCGFGCVICGSPIFEYDHIVEYSKVLAHDEDNITLLCKSHHDMKTSGRMNPRFLRSANQNPCNSKRRFTPPAEAAITGSSDFILHLGGNKYPFILTRGREAPVVVLDGLPFLSLSSESGCVLISLTLYDDVRRPVLIVERGEIAVSTGVWDYKFEGRVLTIRSARYKVLVKLRFEPTDIKILSGKMTGPLGSTLSIDGTSIQIESRIGINPVTARMKDNTYQNGCLLVYPNGAIQTAVTPDGVIVSTTILPIYIYMRNRLLEEPASKARAEFASAVVRFVSETARASQNSKIFDLAHTYLEIANEYVGTYKDDVNYYRARFNKAFLIYWDSRNSNSIDKMSSAYELLREALSAPPSIYGGLERISASCNLARVLLAQRKLGVQVNDDEIRRYLGSARAGYEHANAEGADFAFEPTIDLIASLEEELA